ncbi:MAG: hypothetical protein IH600_08065 [Bacteroidetes bacterium]|nr:hypothetical protein [Bacteroidota bacterium]
MLTLYLACLVFGGVLLAISLFSGGDTDSDMDHGLDAHGDIGGDAALDVHGDIAADHALDMHAGADFAAEADLDGDVDMGGDAEASAEFIADQAMEIHADTAGALPTDTEIGAGHPAIVSMQHGVAPSEAPTVHSAFEYLSFRNFVYTTTFFGLTGSLLTWFEMPYGVALGSSIGMGFFAGYVGHRFMRYLRGSESGQALHVSTLIGHAATVALPPTKERKGKVRIVVGGQIVEMLALLHEDSEAEEVRPNEHVFIVAIDKDVAYVDRGDFLDND